MQKNNINHWTQPVNNLDSLLFFAQRLNESLFDYTIDTFKPRVLNTSILCFEAIDVFRDVSADKIDEKNLEYVIDELNWSYKSDNVAKLILKKDSELFFPIVDSGKKDDLKLKLELLLKRLTAKRYFEYSKVFISEAVKANRKKDIEEGIGAFISTLKAAGVSQGNLFHQTHNFFFNPNSPINSVDQIDSFLERFELKAHSYKCIFKVSKDFSEIDKIYNKYHISQVTKDSINVTDGKVRTFVDSITEDEIFLKCDKIRALDINSSRKSSYHILNKLRDYFAFYHHKKKFDVSLDCLSQINHETEQDWNYIRCPLNPMAKGFDKIKSKAAKELDRFLSKAEFNGVSSRKLDRAIDLHGLSIESNNLENQTLNLWISLEMLIPQNNESSKIQQITNVLVPFLTITYLHKLIRYVAKGLTKWNYHKARYYVSKVPADYGENFIERFTAFLSLPEFEQHRNDLLSELDDFPLLRNRLFSFSQLLSKPKNIIKYLQNHETKLFWQIRRIYRTRNQIIHDGKKIGYLEPLVENGHNYLDTFLNIIISLNINDKQINSLEQGIKTIELNYNHHSSFLSKNKDKVIDKENYLDFIFGSIKHYSQQ